MARKYLTQKKQTNEEMFNAVVNNAIDFIDASLDDLNKRPKNGLVDFYTAIELFLKARLMKEHWTLIISKPEQANLKHFSVGDFHSVTLEEAARRLKDAIDDEVSPAALDTFKALGEHRNQIVHFAHTAYDDVNGAKAGVVVEQWHAWAYLHQLLTQQWKAHFADHVSAINRLHARMLKEREFIDARYKALEPELKQLAKSGLIIVPCGKCSMLSGVATESRPWGCDYECRVCQHAGTELTSTRAKVECDACHQEFEFFSKEVIACPHCKHAVDTNKRIALCRPRYAQGDDYCDEGGQYIASCHVCQHPKPSVFFIDTLWSCVACFDRGWQAVACPHCNEFVTGDSEAIEYFACFKCEDGARERMFAGKR